MKAVYFDKFGPPSVLALKELNRPILKPGEVLVEVHAAAINPSDVKNVEGAFKASLPRVPGRDFAGIVIAGDGQIGKEVWGVGADFGISRDGAHAQFLAMPSEWMSDKPSDLSIPEAAACCLSFLTAYTGLIDVAKLQARETVLVTGALGAVGSAAVQIARWKGARVIMADRQDTPKGMESYISTTGKDLAVEVRAATNGRGADIVFDSVGGPLFEAAVKSLSPGGRQVAITSVGDPQVHFNLLDFYRNQSRLFGLNTFSLNGLQIAAVMNEVRKGFDEGRLQPPQIQTWHLDQAVEAYAATEAGKTQAKHVLLPRS